ncbi:ThiF family adenylyltransferase (plasmid) [Bradyrhizobium barranii subsp. barranii]|uniref:ThiF family adenylyltransferase n=1 Tax=Bradyrhizobium barranii subsp. barranii TaxID=2823807 RepID=A0A7Z0QN44_9BRAD|nr:ThiF family adenylyltransferase [Bradyrhizobium barranii]UGX99546.1 ThiF family adenylyltransferase [Bradyrhizobium barranii subsp. barranii]
MSNGDQRSMIREAMQSIAQRKPGKSKLVYDKTRRTIVAVSEEVSTPQALNITADDADMFSVVTLSSGWLREKWPHLTKAGSLPVDFSSWDDGDALTQLELCIQGSGTQAPATLVFGQPPAAPGEGMVISIIPTDKPTHRPDVFVSPDNIAYRAELVEAGKPAGDQREVVFADIEPQLDLRRAGILETTILKDRTVLCIGLGTGGAHVVVELAKSGVGHFFLVDRDRLSVGNVVRHPGGISQVGRAKVNVTRDLILEKNPNAQVDVHAVDVSFDNREMIAGLVQAADLVICGTDNRQSKLLINELCVSANKPAVYGGAFRRAYGGQILRVRPKESPCQQCFVSALPEEASDVEVSSQDDADAIAYSDRPVAVEPGLSLDVLPIATQLAKLALLELLADKSSTLNVLKRDFDAPWYLWLNRPEPGTQYAEMPPLSESRDEMTINRWYGIYFERDEQCAVCGDFLAGFAAAYGIDPSQLPALPEKD